MSTSFSTAIMIMALRAGDYIDEIEDRSQRIKSHRELRRTQASHQVYKTLARSRCSLLLIIMKSGARSLPNIPSQDGAKMLAGRVGSNQPKRYRDDRQARKYWLISFRKVGN